MLQWIYQNGYSFFMGLGAASMAVLLVYRRKTFRLNAWQAVALSVLLLFCGIAGAKGLFILETLGQEASGMSFFGSVLLVPILMPFAGKLFSLQTQETLDACAPCVASIVGFTRFGCMLARCCGGWPVRLFGVTFHWPTQLMESVGDLLIMLYLLYLEQAGKAKGKLYSVFLMTYCPMRFLIEFLRDTPKDWLGFSHGQWFAVAGVIAGYIMMRSSWGKNGGNYEKKSKK